MRVVRLLQYFILQTVHVHCGKVMMDKEKEKSLIIPTLTDNIIWL